MVGLSRQVVDFWQAVAASARMAPIRGPPGAGETWDGMPDDEDQRQDVSW